MPAGTFIGAGVKTVVLFFDKGEPTKNIWYYQLEPGRNMGKTNPLNDNDLEEFVRLQKTKPETNKSWNIKFSELDSATYDLIVRNPNLPEEKPLRAAKEIFNEIKKIDIETDEILQSIKNIL
jgi:type I restriction enzyme M protein